MALPSYFDNAASTSLDPRVWDAMAAVGKESCGNASSVHQSGRKLRRILEEARAEVAELLGASEKEIIFCSSATEANNHALRAWLSLCANDKKIILLSELEHPSVLQTAKVVGHPLKMPVLGSGQVDLAASSRLLEPDVAVSCLMAVNNETGVIQDVASWSESCREAGVPFHCDAVQAAPYFELNFKSLLADSATISAHKFHGPPGVGVLFWREGRKLGPILFGGTQEREHRAGTENVVAAVGLQHALRYAVNERTERVEKTSQLVTHLRKQLQNTVSGVKFHGLENSRVKAILNFSVPKQRGESLIMKLDLAGFCVSLGSACSAGAIEPSLVLAAMGVSQTENLSSLRVSFAHDNRLEEVDRFVATLGEICARESR